MPPNFNKPSLAQNDLADWLSSLSSSPPFERSRVIAQINTAIRKGEIPPPKFIHGKKHLNVKPFLKWAISKEKWRKTLANQPNLNISVSLKVDGVSGDGKAGVVCSGKAEDVLIASLKKENAEPKAENDHYKNACKLRSERAKQAGRLGGRPKKEKNRNHT